MPEISPQDWYVLEAQLEEKKVTPIVGDRFFSNILPSAAELVDAWKDSDSVNYPYDSRPSIGRLARFVSAKARDPRLAYLLFVNEYLAKKVAPTADIPRRTLRRSSVTEFAAQLGCLEAGEAEDSALSALAKLPLKIYITTSYFTALERALIRAKKEPESAICYWRQDLKPGLNIRNERGKLLKTFRERFTREDILSLAYEVPGDLYDNLSNGEYENLHRELIEMSMRTNRLKEVIHKARELRPGVDWRSLMEGMGIEDSEKVSRVPSIFEDENDYEPSESRPLVFHLYGIDMYPASLVLTQDDYIDFLIHLSKKRDTLPRQIISALTQSSLVLLGYELHEWEFIILFRGLIASWGRQRNKVNICLQPPLAAGEQGILSERENEVEEYLERYLDRDEFSIYWGGPDKFLAELRDD